jgi:hypothetical protein
VEVLEKYIDVFAKNKYDLGCCTKGTHHIDTGDAEPIHCVPHKIGYAVRKDMKEILDDMLDVDVIEPSTSPWAAPALMVKKKDGEWRLCVDFRKLNAIARTSAYPLPRIQDIFTQLHRMRYFSSLDMVKGFWQIPLDYESREKTSFTTVFGQYQFKRLPFGLATSPAAFQSIMNLALAGLNWIHCMVYIDDVLIFSNTWEEHLLRLGQVCEKLIEADLKAKLVKCEFARSQLLYLGHTC